MTDIVTRYRYLLMLASDGIIIYDQSGRIIDFNEGACRHLGYTKEEFASLSLKDLLWEDDLQRRPVDFSGLLSGKQVTDRRKIKTKNGKVYIVETSTAMLPDGNMMALAKDVTEKVAIEKDLKMKEHAIATSISGMGMATLEGRIFYVNETLCRMWGFAGKEEMEGKSILEMFDSSETESTLQNIIENGIEYREAKARRKDGSTFYVALSGNAVKDKQGRPFCVFGSFIDITSRKLAKEKLEAKYRQMELIATLTDAVSRAEKPEEIYEITIRGLVNSVHADRVSILQFNKTGGLEFRASFGLSDDYKKFTAGHSPWSRDCRDPKPVFVPDAETEDSLKDLLPVISREGIRALGFIPLVYGGRLLGKFMVYFNRPHLFTEEESQLLQTIAREVSFAIGEKEREMALRKSEQLYREVVDHTREIIFQAGTNGCWLFLNPAWSEILGYAREESIGKPVQDFVYPDDREQVKMCFSELTGQVKEHCHNELRFLSKEGNICWMEITGRVLFNEQGEAAGISGILRDITESKRSREQIIREKELSDSVINTLPGIFYIYNQQGKFMRWNKNLELVSGYSGQEIAGMIPLDFFDKDDKEYMYERSKTTFTEGNASAESFLLTKSSKKIPYYFNCIAVVYEGELCSMGMGIDITERFKAERELEESARQLRELSAHLQDVREEERAAIAREIHDELGQQLTVLKVDFSWLRSQLDHHNDPQVLKRLTGLENLLDNAMGTVRKLSFALRPGMLDDLGLAETIDWYLHDYRERFNIHTTFSNNIESDTIPEKVKTAMFRIFQESLTNVIRHSKATRADVELLEEGNNIILRIEDNGKGFIPAEVAGKKTLGLIGMKERTLLMGGKFHISSKPGSGTVVTVTATVPAE
ncbi:MAG: PAS domain S-box protein [Chitinophagaceae bacterium]